MAQNNNGLPEGTDTVIEAGGGLGQSNTTFQGGSPSTGTNATGERTKTTASDAQTDAFITGGGSSSGTSAGSGDDASSPGGIRGMVGNVTTKARDEAANRARGFVGDGLKSGSTTLGNISSLIGDTVSQIEEKLGPQYAGYARTASETIQRYATTLENKNPDELVDDARDLVRKSPGVAIAGAAILGFGLVRLLKAGMPQESDNGNGDRQGNRTRSTR